MIEPFASFSLIYPINQAIALVNKQIKKVFKIPTTAKNITPCKKPNNIAWIRFAQLNPTIFDNLFSR